MENQNNYRTVLVAFARSLIAESIAVFTNPDDWGTTSLKEWIEGYETVRFTPIDKQKAIITGERNLAFVEMWIEKHCPDAKIVDLDDCPPVDWTETSKTKVRTTKMDVSDYFADLLTSLFYGDGGDGFSEEEIQEATTFIEENRLANMVDKTEPTDQKVTCTFTLQ